ncbi:MAG: radical SAM protein [Candidatus Omnitrophota bacterium]
MPANTALNRLLAAIRGCGITIRRTNRLLELLFDPAKTDFARAAPYLYVLLNSFEKYFFIIIYGVSPCLMPDAADHIRPSRQKSKGFQRRKACLLCKYQASCPGWPRRLEASSPSFVPDIPGEVVLEVTRRCNLGCRQCSHEKSSLDIPLSRVKNVIDETVVMGVKTLRLTGGEPLLYPKLKQTLSYAKAKGLYCILNSNLTLFEKSHEDWIPALVDNILVSMQGHDNASESRLTGRPSDFNSKLKILVRLRKKMAVLRLGTVISRTLLENFRHYVKWMGFIRPDCWELYRPMADPGADPEFRIRVKDYRDLLACVRQNDQESCEIKFSNAIPFCGLKASFEDSRFFLGARADDGHSRLVYDPRGFFKPSYFLNRNLGKNLAKAWSHPFLKKIHSLDYLTGLCGSCRQAPWCLGGSRFWAKESRGDFFAKDPLMGRGQQKP